MSTRTSVTIIASPRPRVGTTLLARLVTSFRHHEGGNATAFDVNKDDEGGTLARYLPGQAAPAAVTDIKQQMALFDALVASDGVHKVVDLGQDSFEAFFAIAETVGFGEEASARGIAASVLFMLTPDRTSVEAFRSLRRRFPQLALGLVHNDMFGHTQHSSGYGFGETVARLPVLAPALRKYVEVPPFSFDEEHLARATGIPLEVHIELQRWLRRCYQELRELEAKLAPAATARALAP